MGVLFSLAAVFNGHCGAEGSTARTFTAPSSNLKSIFGWICRINLSFDFPPCLFTTGGKGFLRRTCAAKWGVVAPDESRWGPCGKRVWWRQLAEVFWRGFWSRYLRVLWSSLSRSSLSFPREPYLVGARLLNTDERRVLSIFSVLN